MAKGETIAVDINCKLNGLTLMAKNSLPMASTPPCPLDDVAHSLSSWDRILREPGITSMRVLDGHKHPMKYNSYQSRASNKLKGKNLDNDVTHEDMEEVMKYVKITVTTNNNLLRLVIFWMKNNSMRYVYVLVESEWKCVLFEILKVVNGIMSKDRDCVMLM